MLNKIKRLTQSALLKDSLIYVVGEMTAKAVPFLLLPYLTRVLGTTGFGDLSYYLSLTAFIVIAMSLSQNGALTRYFYVYGRHGLGNILLAGGLYSVGVLLIGGALRGTSARSVLATYGVLCAGLGSARLAAALLGAEWSSYTTIGVGFELGSVAVVLALLARGSA